MKLHKPSDLNELAIMLGVAKESPGSIGPMLQYLDPKTRVLVNAWAVGSYTASEVAGVVELAPSTVRRASRELVEDGFMLVRAGVSTGNSRGELVYSPDFACAKLNGRKTTRTE